MKLDGLLINILKDISSLQNVYLWNETIHQHTECQ